MRVAYREPPTLASASLQGLLSGLRRKEAGENSRMAAETLAELTRQARAELLPRRYRTIDREFAFLLRYLTTVDTIGTAMQEIVDFGSTFWSDVSEVWIEERDGRVSIRSRTPATDPIKLFLHELRKGAMCLGMLRWLSGDQLHDLRAEFFQMPVDPPEVMAVFPFAISSTDGTTAFSLPSGDVRKRVLRRPHEAAAVLQGPPLLAFGTGHCRAAFSTHVRRFLDCGLDLNGQAPSQAAVCRDAAVSQATLHRRLRDAGTSFQALRDQVLNDRAKTLLAESDATVIVISGLLGYSEDRSFRRSFQRWNGCTPLAFRQAAQA